MRTNGYGFLFEWRGVQAESGDARRAALGSRARARAERSAPALRSLPMPAGVAFLSLAPDGEPELSSDPGPVAVEELVLAGRPHLLLVLLDRDSARVSLNGAPAPRAALLEVGDELVLGGGRPLFVTRARAGGVAPAGAAEAGETCPVCRTPVRAGQNVSRCECGEILHAEGGEVPAEERLECVQLAGRVCPACRRGVQLEGGLEYVPAGMALAGDHAEPAESGNAPPVLHTAPAPGGVALVPDDSDLALVASGATP